VKTVRATKFGQSARGNRTWRAPCGCKVEILPAALGEVDIHYCDAHGEASTLIEACRLVDDLRRPPLDTPAAVAFAAVRAVLRGSVTLERRA
jgi:hypothetical protein